MGFDTPQTNTLIAVVSLLTTDKSKTWLNFPYLCWLQIQLASRELTAWSPQENLQEDGTSSVAWTAKEDNGINS